MPSRTGIFIGLTQVELAALRVSALARISSGDRTSISGGGKSGTKAYSMSAADVLSEIVIAEQASGVKAARVKTVVQDLTGYYPRTA